MRMFGSRRDQLAAGLEDGVVILPAADAPFKSNDVEHEYHQDPDFWYLTGFGEPGALAVLMPRHETQRFVLFVRPREPEKEIWTGRRAGPEGAVRDFGADAAYPASEFDSRLPGLLVGSNRLYYRLGRNESLDRRVLAALEEARRMTRKNGVAPSEIVDPAVLVHEMRLRKSPEEIALLRRACEISCEAHRAAMSACRPGMSEYQLEAILEYVFRRSGSAGPGYPSIVGGGENATVLHYSTNGAPIAPGDLVLIDAGCEWSYYNADITRTFPASGRFTPPQRAVYELVLKAQQDAIATIRPGVPFETYHDRAVRVLTEGLVQLGLLAGPPDTLIEQEVYKRFYPHGTGHWLGIDVHDAGRYRLDGQSRLLEPGMVLTVEPGLYVRADDKEAPEEYRGIGVRIEDDVLVTDSGHEVLTSALPRSVEELEALVGSGTAPVVQTID